MINGSYVILVAAFESPKLALPERMEDTALYIALKNKLVKLSELLSFSVSGQ